MFVHDINKQKYLPTLDVTHVTQLIMCQTLSDQRNLIFQFLESCFEM